MSDYFFIKHSKKLISFESSFIVKFIIFRWWDNSGSRAEIPPRDTELRFRNAVSRCAVLFTNKETFSEGRNRKFWQKTFGYKLQWKASRICQNIRTFFVEEMENLKATGNLKCTLETKGHLRKSFSETGMLIVTSQHYFINQSPWTLVWEKSVLKVLNLL